MFALLSVLAAHASDADRFTGTWAWTGGAADEAARTAAIEATVAEMPFLFRPFARSRIGAATTIPASLQIVVTGAYVRLWGLETRWVGTPVQHTGDGGAPETVTRRIEGPVLVHEARQSDGLGREEYRLTGPDTLTFGMTVESDQLTLPIRYTLHYQRAP